MDEWCFKNIAVLLMFILWYLKNLVAKHNRMWQTSGEEYEIKYVKLAKNSRHESASKTNNLWNVDQSHTIKNYLSPNLYSMFLLKFIDLWQIIFPIDELRLLQPYEDFNWQIKWNAFSASYWCSLSLVRTM